MANNRAEFDKRLAFVESLYRNERDESAAVSEALKELGVVGPEEKKAPFEKAYFNGDMLAKYESCMDNLQLVIDADGEDDDAWASFELMFGKFMDFSWVSQWDGKRYDIVFYGVSGYTGYLMMEYLKRVALKRNPESFTFAFAGRTASRVATMRDREFLGTQWEDIPILTATYDDPVTMIDLARSARCILNVAGPYMLAPGEIMLDACCYAGTHYVDINGEIPWFFRTFDLDKRARASNTIIAPSCAPAGGIPDMLTYLCHKKLKEQYGAAVELRKSTCYSTGGGSDAGGRTSGGTLATRNAMTTQEDSGRLLMADPFALSGFIPDRDRNGLKVVNIRQGTGETTMKVRKEDTDAALSKITEDKVNKVWRIPNTYAFFDTRVIRRTNALLADHCGAPYGRNFSFGGHSMLPVFAEPFGGPQPEDTSAGSGMPAQAESAPVIQMASEPVAQAVAGPDAERKAQEAAMGQARQEAADAERKAQEAAADQAAQEAADAERKAGEASQGPSDPNAEEQQRKDWAAAASAGTAQAASGGGVAGEKAALEAAGLYYKQGEGPPLEELSDAWSAWLCYVETEDGHSEKNFLSGNDGYFETARTSTEACMAFVFDYDRLPIKGGCVTCAAIGGDAIPRRMIASGVKFAQGRWMDPHEMGHIDIPP